MTQREQIEALQEAAEAAFLALRLTPHGSLRFVTKIVLAAVVSADEPVPAAFLKSVQEHDLTYRKVLSRNGYISRHAGGQTRFADVFEIDLLPRKLVCSAMKAALLMEFGVDVGALASHQRVAILHTHGVVDCRGHSSPEALARDLRSVWCGPRGVHLAKLYTEGTRAQNLSRIAGYSTKFVHRYSRAWNGKKTEFLGDYEPEWRGYVLRAYEAIGYHKLLITNIVSQKRMPVCHVEMYVECGDSVGETNDSDALQLMLSVPQTEHNQDKPSNTNESPSQPSGRTMRAHEIIADYIDPSKMPDELYREITRAIERQGPEPMTDEVRYALYGDERDDIEIEQLRLDLTRTKAEIAELLATATRDRAEAAKFRADEGFRRP